MKWFEISVPRVVEGANFVGVERDDVALFVAVIWGVRSDGGERGEGGEEEAEEGGRGREEVLHWEEVWISKPNPTDEEEKRRGRRGAVWVLINGKRMSMKWRRLTATL